VSTLHRLRRGSRDARETSLTRKKHRREKERGGRDGKECLHKTCDLNCGELGQPGGFRKKKKKTEKSGRHEKNPWGKHTTLGGNGGKARTRRDRRIKKRQKGAEEKIGRGPPIIRCHDMGKTKLLALPCLRDSIGKS